MNINKQLLYALISTVGDNLQDSDEFNINTWNGAYDTRHHFDYEISLTTPQIQPRQPCPACPDGDPGAVGEFEFTATIFGLDIDLDKLAQCFYDELEEVIMGDIVG